jgi:hypothetical protein
MFEDDFPSVVETQCGLYDHDPSLFHRPLPADGEKGGSRLRNLTSAVFTGATADAHEWPAGDPRHGTKRPGSGLELAAGERSPAVQQEAGGARCVRDWISRKIASTQAGQRTVKGASTGSRL